MHTVRFDMRVSGMSPTQIADQYQAAIDMARWMDQRGGFSVAVSEHHASQDGYIPAPLLLASSMAAVTDSISIMVAATLLPLYEPVHLAEEMIVLDYISRGRVSYVLALGYRPDEYELFGLDYSQRGAIADEKLEKLLATFDQAILGEGMPRVTPASFTPHRPTVFWGGGSKPAARRAGRNGLGFLAQNTAPGLEEVGPYLLADALSYGEWNQQAGMDATNLSLKQSVDGLREEQGNYRVVDVKGAVELIQQWGRLPLHPLCGGCPPDITWPYLRRVVEEVMPAIAGG